MNRFLRISLAFSIVLSLAVGETLARGGGGRRGGGRQAMQGSAARGQFGYGASNAAMLQQRMMMQYRYQYGQSGIAIQGRSVQGQMRGRTQSGQAVVGNPNVTQQQQRVQRRARNGQAELNNQNASAQQRLRDGSCSGGTYSEVKLGGFGRGIRARSTEAMPRVDEGPTHMQTQPLR
jgi:hypothetical protein